MPNPPKLEDLFSVEKFVNNGYYIPRVGPPSVETSIPVEGGFLFETNPEVEAAQGVEVEVKTGNHILILLVHGLFLAFFTNSFFPSQLHPLLLQNSHPLSLLLEWILR